ncbi:MAG: SPOR domain-containing protein, partial [Hydrogenovibrio sp.]
GLEPNQEVQYGNIDFLWTFNSDWNAEASYDYSLLQDQLTQGYRINWQNRYFLSSLRYFETEGNNSIQLNFSFSLGHDPLDSLPVVSAQRLANTGSVSAVVYEDLNNDQQRQANEPVIPNAQVIATQQRRRAKTDEDGKAFIPGLYGTTPTDVTVVPKSLEDPFWIPSGDGTAFLPRPGLVKVVEIPIVTAGEVEGQVAFQSELFSDEQDQGGVPLILTDHQRDRSFTTRSAFDGFFLFDMIPPGDYELSVDPDYLKKHQLASRRPMQVKIGARGTLIVGANFDIYPESLYRYQNDADDSGQSFALDFGTFLSEKNARMVLNALRQVFPQALGQATSENGFEVAMQQNQLGQVNLSLAPLQDLDQAKYVCGALASEGLPCQIRPLASPQPAKPSKLAPTTKTTAVTPPATKPPGLVKNEAPAQRLKSESTPVKTAPMATKAPPKIEGNGFTIQLVSVSGEFAAEEYIESNGLTQAKIQPRRVNGDVMFAVIYGHYPTRQAAQADAQKLKTQLNIQPWIKPL